MQRRSPERRLARNEGLFRETNEAIERGGNGATIPTKPEFAFPLPECSRLDCSEAVAVTLGAE